MQMTGTKACYTLAAVPVEDPKEVRVFIDVQQRHMRVLHVHAPTLHRNTREGGARAAAAVRLLRGARAAEVGGHDDQLQQPTG